MVTPCEDSPLLPVLCSLPNRFIRSSTLPPLQRTRMRAARPSPAELLSHGFVPRQRQRSESTYTERYRFRCVPTSAFLGPSSVYSSPYLVALFHATGTPGVHTLQGLPLSKEPYCVTTANAVLPFFRAWGLSAEAKKSRSFSRLHGFTLSGKSVGIRWRFRPTKPRCPPGFSPLQGVPSHRRRTAFTVPPPMHFRGRPRSDPLPRASEFHRAVDSACLSRDCRPSWGL